MIEAIAKLFGFHRTPIYKIRFHLTTGQTTNPIWFTEFKYNRRAEGKFSKFEYITYNDRGFTHFVPNPHYVSHIEITDFKVVYVRGK